MAYFGKDGKYSSSPGSQELQPSEGVSLSLDPSSVPGLEDFQPGDEVDLKIKARVGEADEDGMTSMEVLTVEADPMDSAAKVHRRDMGPKKMNMDLVGGEGEEE